MEGYNEIANTRFHQLVSKIVHHTKMKEIEVNVRNSNLVTSEVFQILGENSIPVWRRALVPQAGDIFVRGNCQQLLQTLKELCISIVVSPRHANSNHRINAQLINYT